MIVSNKLHYFAATVHTSSKKIKEAYYLCCEVLHQLGEEIPQSFYFNQVTKMVQQTSELVHKMSERDLLEMEEMNEKLALTMNFYSIIMSAAFFAKPEIVPFVACRMVQLTQKNGLCKYSIVGFVQLAMALSNKRITKKVTKKNIEDASQIGKAAMSCYQNRYNTSDQLPQLSIAYYGFFAWHIESLQKCAEMLRRGFDAGMSLGQTQNALVNSIHDIKYSFAAGYKLPTLLDKLDYTLELANKHQQNMAKVYLMMFRGTLSALINKLEASSPKSYDPPTEMVNAHVLEVMYGHRALQAFWQGHSDRCQHYIKKFLASCFDEWRIVRYTAAFIHGLSSFQLLRVRPRVHLKAITRQNIQLLKTAAGYSSWNFQNKVSQTQS